MSDKRETYVDFIPDLCSVQAVLALILVGELLALALVVVDLGIARFTWWAFGSVSMMIQWVVLSSAACLCPLRSWFRHQPSWVAGATSYVLVLALTMLISVLGQWVLSANTEVLLVTVCEHLLLAGIFAGVALRYFYIQQQLHNHQQAELVARIQALQSRIRPHFLFNSMNSIASLIMSSPALAEKMVEDLSQLFRASLTEPSMVPVEQELSLCKRFVAIEQLRLGDRLCVNWCFPDVADWQAAKIPSFLLQPLVENAIYHGIQPLPSGGTVEFSVENCQKVLRFTVSNPLPKTHAPHLHGNGLALQNIRSRLAAHYGAAGTLAVTQSENRYQVQVTCPK